MKVGAPYKKKKKNCGLMVVNVGKLVHTVTFFCHSSKKFGFFEIGVIILEIILFTVRDTPKVVR